MGKRVGDLYDNSVLIEKFSQRIRCKTVEQVKELSDCTSLSKLFIRLAELYAYIIYTPIGMKDTDEYLLESKNDYYSVFLRRELAVAKDVRFNYKDGEIYIPFTSYRYNTLSKEALNNFDTRGYSESDLIRNSASKDKIVIYKDNKYILDSIDIILGDVNNNLKLIRLDISNLPVYETSDIEASELFDKFLKCCYSGRQKSYLEDFFYTSDKYSGLEYKHKRVLRELSIPWYTEEVSHFYKCFRKYKLEDIKNDYTEEELGLNEMEEKCLIDFESCLYYILQGGKNIVGWYRGTLKELKEGRLMYLKYKRGSVALIMLSEIFTKGVVKNVRR